MSATEVKTDFTSRDRWLMFAIVLAPMAPLTHLLISYALVPTACAQGSKLWLHVSTIVFLIVSVAAGLIARWRDDGDDRTRWMVKAAIALSAMSVLTILAMEIPNLLLRSCD